MQLPLLSLLLLLQPFASVLNAAAPPQVNLCYSVRTTNGATPPFYVTKFAIEYYRATYPNYNWTLVPISNGNFNPTIRDSVQSMVNQGASCDALLGPGSSSYSVALSPVVNQPWIDFASTSTDLSDKSVYTWFNRVITTDAQIGGAMADVLLGMGWRYVNLLTSNDAYGSSIAQQLTASFVASGGLVVISQQLPISATLAAAHAYLDLLEQGSNSRIIAVGTANGNPLYANIINATLTRGLQNKYVFLFSESACGGDAQWHVLPGALCVTFSVNSTMSGPLLSAYLARDMTSDFTMAAQYGRPTAPTTAQLTTFNVFTAFAHDAVLAMMAAINSLGGVPVKTSASLAAVHSVSVLGLTGMVSFNSKGDRADLQMVVLNVLPGGIEQTIASISNHTMVAAVNTSTLTSVQPYWLSSYFSSVAPRDVFPTPSTIAAWVIPIVVVGCIIAVSLLTLVAVASRRTNARDVANAPTTGRIAIMFSDIQDSTRLWGALPFSMTIALEMHHTLIRAAIAKHKGYEVKTIGDSFMIAVSSEDAAVRIAVDIQRALQAAAWPPCIARAYACKSDEELEAIDDDPTAPSVHDGTFNGLRVRIGIHSGEPKAELDPVTQGYDYYGPMVNVAARVESAALGGQICISNEALSHVQDKTGLSIRALGRFELKGVAEGAELHEIMPEELAVSRRFAYGESAVVAPALEITGSTDVSDTASAVGGSDYVFKPAHVALFFTRVLFKALMPGEAKKVRAALMKAWHVSDDAAAGPDKNDDPAMERLCRRVLPSALRQARKAHPDDDGTGSAFSASRRTRGELPTPKGDVKFEPMPTPHPSAVPTQE